MPKLPQVDSAIWRLTAEPGHAQTEFRDERTPGLSLVIGKKARTWFLTYKAPDDQRKRISLGRYPAVGLASARDRSNEVFRTLHDDIDPARARRAYRQSSRSRRRGWNISGYMRPKRPPAARMRP